MRRRVAELRAVSGARVTYKARPGTAREAELSALAAIYTFVLFDSQAKRGGTHDLTNGSTKKQITGPEKKGKDNADLYGN